MIVEIVAIVVAVVAVRPGQAKPGQAKPSAVYRWALSLLSQRTQPALSRGPLSG